MAEGAEEVTHDERPRRNNAAIRSQVVGILAGIVRWVGLFFAVILVLHVILTVGGANPNNGITTFVRDWADTVAMGFKDLFLESDLKLRTLINYGIAAIFWLIVSSVAARLIRRLG
ncbi:hypothetical protein EV193_101841 [Herbihabitans rhizosphaerae]|uniref:YGGT family protein n=1 Tax=Herbihabitans rhizosphaerae TaxID=1872711 RepID=A0A4Q7L7T0_9PSEU|nr:hypothetical protein [Herbihabitans rhizosphaerae]RZS44960.1 hypothetical protein EV193_101841 [Herbihabitans rhizosphaerae]